jgi:very-short-patch-repair endonuclease
MNADDESPRDRGRRLRAESTSEERRSWRYLRAKRFAGFKFRRQHRIGSYYADFCCIERRLIIELDGSQHAEPEVETRDADRTAYLREQGYRVIRFWNEQVKRETNEVLEAIYAALRDL